MTIETNTRPAHVRTAAKSYDEHDRHNGPGPWLALIHEVNRLQPGTFAEPESTGAWWAGGYVEEYAAARVLHRGDETVSVTSKTDDGARLIREAAAALGLTVADL